jgi:hypothetical protein
LRPRADGQPAMNGWEMARSERKMRWSYPLVGPRLDRMIKSGCERRCFPDLFGKTSRFRGKFSCRARLDGIAADNPIGISARP